MINYFENSEYEKARKQRTRMISIYLAVLAVFVAFAIYMLIFYIRLPYQSPKIATVKWIVYPVTTVFIFFSFLYLGVPYKKIKRQLNFCQNLVFGLKEETTAAFFEYQDVLHDKDGVDCKSLIFLEWNARKNDYFERKVLVFAEKDFPQIPEKAKVKFITQGNFLLSYEILEG